MPDPSLPGPGTRYLVATYTGADNRRREVSAAAEMTMVPILDEHFGAIVAYVMAHRVDELVAALNAQT